MKRVIFFLALCIVLAQPASAEFNSKDMIPGLISKGFDMILESQADNMYNMIGMNNSNVQPAVSILMAQKNDFLSNPMVQKQKNFTAFWYFVFYIIFLLAGGIGVMKESASFDTMGNVFGSWRNKYFECLQRESDPFRRRSKRVNETQSHKIIVPLPPRYIVEKLQLGPLELSWDQVKVMLVCAILTTIVVGAGEGVSGLLLNFIALLIIWGLYYKFARTHEVLVESKIIFAHKIRKLKGLDRYSSVSSTDKQVSELYRFSIKNISKTGVIDFGDNRFGVILGCDTRWLDDEELVLNISRISGFLNSIQPRTLLKVRASSQISYLNPVERMVMEQVNEPRSQPVSTRTCAG